MTNYVASWQSITIQNTSNYAVIKICWLEHEVEFPVRAIMKSIRQGCGGIDKMVGTHNGCNQDYVELRQWKRRWSLSLCGKGASSLLTTLLLLLLLLVRHKYNYMQIQRSLPSSYSPSYLSRGQIQCRHNRTTSTLRKMPCNDAKNTNTNMEV